MNPHKKTWVKIMALLALIGIVLSVVGTAWMAITPSSTDTSTTPSTNELP